MHMISKKDLSNAEMETLTKSCSPTIVITANGEVQTHEEPTVYVKELDIFLTVKILEDTPAVLSLGKLCEDHGCPCEWTSGQKPCLIKYGCSDTMQYGKLRSNRGPMVIDDFFFVKLVGNNTSNIITAGKYRLNTFASISGKGECRRERTERPIFQPNQNPQTKKKGPRQETVKPVFFRIARMAARIQRKSFGWKSPQAQRLSREFFFSWALFRAAETSGAGQSLFLHTLPERPKLRDPPED